MRKFPLVAGLAVFASGASLQDQVEVLRISIEKPHLEGLAVFSLRKAQPLPNSTALGQSGELQAIRESY